MSDDEDRPRKGDPEKQSIINKDSKLKNVETEIKQTQGVLLKSIELSLAKGEQINSLEDKSVKMSANAETFKRKAAETKRVFCFNHYRNILILLVILAVFTLFCHVFMFRLLELLYI